MFAKTIQKADYVRHYSIQRTSVGWEVRTEQNSEAVRQVCYQDWHRVERALRVFILEVDSLEQDGWTAVNVDQAPMET